MAGKEPGEMKGPDRKEQSAPMKPGKDEKIILASGSPRRRAMMEYFGVPFEVIPSELSEFFAEGEGQWRALDMARKKAFMLSRKVKGRYILAADTMVQVGKHYLGKPKDRDEDVYKRQAHAHGLPVPHPLPLRYGQVRQGMPAAGRNRTRPQHRVLEPPLLTLRAVQAAFGNKNRRIIET